jgi:hypothetical protein
LQRRKESTVKHVNKRQIKAQNMQERSNKRFAGHRHSPEVKAQISATQKRRYELLAELLKRHEAEQASA